MRILYAGAVALLVLGCRSTDSDHPTRLSIRDSAGIRIVEHAGDPTAALAPLALTAPVFTHGGKMGHYLFERVFAGTLLPDGSVAVADAGASEIVLLAADGTDYLVLAGSGEGPSEVRRPMSVLALAGGGILVEDDGNEKLVEFRGGFARTSSLAGEIQLTHGLLARALDASGRLLMTTSSFRSDAGEGWIPGHMVRLDPETRAADTVATYDMAISRPRDEPFDPFSPFGQAAASRAGFVHARSDRPELVWRDPAGRIRQIVRWHPERTYPTDRHLEAYADWRRQEFARNNPDVPAEAVDAVLEERGSPELVPDRPLPLYSDVTDHGSEGVWLSDYWLSDATADVVAGFSAAYAVVSADAETFRRVTLPRPAKVLDVADGRVLAVVQDELGVQHIAVYELPTP